MDSEEAKIKLSNDLSKKIDSLVGELKKSLLNSPYNSRGVFDKVKNWWQNLTKGADNTNNPYYFQNKFGSLGKFGSQVQQNKPEPVQPEQETKEKEEDEDDGFSLGTSRNESKFTLKEYAFLSEVFKSLDTKISSLILNEQDYASNNLKNLEIFKIIDSWATHFKKEIMNMLTGHESMPSIQKNRAETESALPKGLEGRVPKTSTANNGVSFKGWIKNESNMEYFVNLVNKIFDSPLYRRPQSTIASSLENKHNIINPKKGEEGTPLTISIRNKIIGIIQKEIEYGRDESKSVFSKKVWEWAKGLSQFGKKQKDEVEEVPAVEPKQAAADRQEDAPTIPAEDLIF
jgi:hypothetical protein